MTDYRYVGFWLVRSTRKVGSLILRWETLFLLVLTAPRLLWFEYPRVLIRGDLIYPLRGSDFYASIGTAWRDLDLGVPSLFQPRLARPLYWFPALSDFLGVGPAASELFYVFMLTLLAGTSVHLLFARFVSPPHYATIGSMAAAAVYLYNPYLIADGSQSALLYLDLYAFMPLAVLLVVTGIAKGDLRYAAALGVISPVLLSHLPSYSLGVLSLFVVAWFLAFFLLRRETFRRAGKFTAVALAVGITFNLYWIILWVPALPPILATASGFAPSETEIWRINAYASLENVFRGLGKWGFYGSHLDAPLVPYAQLYVTNPLLIALTLVVPIVAMSALLFSRGRRRSAFLATGFLLLIFAAKGPHAPFGEIFLASVQNPLLAGFRESFFFLQPASLFAALLFGIATAGILARVSRPIPRRRILRVNHRILATGLVGLVLAASWPLVTGDVTVNWYGEPAPGVNVPGYVWEASAFVNSMEGDFRVAFVPPLPTYIAFDWGYQGGSDLLLTIFKKPVILGNSGQYLASSSRAAIDGMYGAMDQNFTQRLGRLLRIFDVRVLVVPTDLNLTFMGLPDNTIEKYVNVLNSQMDIRKRGEFGRWILYGVVAEGPAVSNPDEAVPLEKITLGQDRSWASNWEVYGSNGFERTSSSRSEFDGFVYFEFPSTDASADFRYSFAPDFDTSLPARWLTVEFFTNAESVLIVAVTDGSQRNYLVASNPTAVRWGNNYQATAPALLHFLLPEWFSLRDTVELYLSPAPEMSDSILPAIGLGSVSVLAMLGSVEDMSWYVAANPMRSPVFVEGAEVRSLLGSPTNGTMSIPLSTPLSVVIRRTGTAAFSFEVTDSPGVVALVLPQSYAPEWQLVGPGEIMYHGKANLYANLWLVQFTGSGSFVASYGLQRLAEDLPVATAGLAVLVFSVGLVLTIRKHRLERRKAQASVVGD